MHCTPYGCRVLRAYVAIYDKFSPEITLNLIKFDENLLSPEFTLMMIFSALMTLSCTPLLHFKFLETVGIS
jgi:hypothetical protein